MDEVDPGALGQAGQQQLLATHPFEAVGDANRHLDLGDQLAPRPRSGVAVHKRGETHAGRCGRDERRNRLARGDLHPTGLAGNEEDQV
jgi:hypothetical protein